MVAFTGDYDGNKDVYVVAAAGGEPKRLTYHPGTDEVVAWTPNGKNIVFRSTRASYYHFADKLFTVPAAGGFPSELPLPIGEEAAYSPDGTHLAYVPHPQWQAAWKRYRGGQTTPIWIADLKDSSVVKIPRENSTDFNPLWVGNTIYFLSDRNGLVSLFAYDTATRKVSEALKSEGFDFKSASAGPDAIIIEQFGSLHLYDLNTHQSKTVNIRVAGDFAQVRPGFVKVEPKRIHAFNLSPTGTRALMEAWGEIFTVPTDKGDIRNVTHSPAVADRDPAWSPDGKWVAWFSDESGEYALHLRAPDGLGPVRTLSLGQPPSFFYSPRWSPCDESSQSMSRLPSAELRSWFGEIDIYLFDQILRGRFDERPRVLDAGCGDGRNLPLFLRRGFTEAEVRETIRRATWKATSDGRWEAARDFDYKDFWNGTYYPYKRVRPIFVELPDEIVVVTVYTFYL